MRIVVDADACPVKDILIRIARERQIPVIMVCDTAHELSDSYSTHITVDKARDSADICLANLWRERILWSLRTMEWQPWRWARGLER